MKLSLRAIIKKGLWAIVGMAVICAIFVAITVVGIFAATPAFYISLAFLLIPGLAVFRPLPALKLGNRLFSAALAVVAGVFGLFGTSLMMENEQRVAMEDLKLSDPITYLAELKSEDNDQWLEELAELDPAAYELEAARIAEEKQLAAERLAAEEALEAEKKAAVEAKAREEKTRKLLAGWREERLAREAKQARACGDSNTTLAYVMSQNYVKASLKAPSTAKFPWVTSVNVQPIGDCKFRVSAYVDSQNGFGAMLRTHYTATMIHSPDSNGWLALSLDFHS